MAQANRTQPRRGKLENRRRPGFCPDYPGRSELFVFGRKTPVRLFREIEGIWLQWVVAGEANR
jgi:hypothetical protein